jgi:hypothetical protein
MPAFPKRRFQHGAMPAQAMRAHLGQDEGDYRRIFNGFYA